MDEQEQQQLELYIQTLQDTYLGKETSTIQGAEKYLKSMQDKDQFFVKHMLQVAINSVNLKNLEIESVPEQTRQQACLQIVTYIKRYLNNTEKNINYIGDYAQLLLQAIMSDELKLKAKTNLMTAVLFILQFDNKNGQIRQMYISNIVPSLQQNSNIQAQYNSLLILGCIFEELSQGSSLNKVFDQIIQPMEQSLSYMLDQFNVKTNEYMNLENQFLELKNQQNVQEEQLNLLLNQKNQVESIITQCLQTTQEWMNCFLQMVKKFLSKSSPDYKALIFKVIQLNTIAQKFITLLGVQMSTKSQLDKCIISTSGYRFFDKPINKCKARVLKIYEKIVNFTLHHQNQFDRNNCTYFKHLQEVLPVFIQTPINFLNAQSRQRLEDVLESKEVNIILPSIFSFIAIGVQNREFYQFYQSCYQQMILDVVFPVLRVTKSELEDMKENPQEFVNTSLDIMEKQRSNIGKTQAAKFLEGICDFVDGAGAFSIKIACFMIDKVLSQEVQQNISNNNQNDYSDVEKYINSNFVQVSNQEETVSTSLLVLAVLSYLIVKRDDLARYIQNIIQRYHHYFFQRGISQIIQCRFIQVLAGTHEFIFQKKSEGSEFQAILSFLSECTTKSKKNQEKALQLLATSTLKDIYETESFNKNSMLYLGKNFKQLQKTILISNNPDFFDLILEIMINFKQYLKQNGILVESLVEIAVKRILTQVQKVLEKNQIKKKSKQAILFKLFNLITHITEQDIYSHLLPQIKQIILPLFDLLQYSDQMFTYDVLTIIKNIIRKQQQIDDDLIKVVPYFLPWLEHKNNILHDMMIVLNLYIFYGNQFIRNSPLTIKTLFDICFQTLNANQESSSDADRAEGAILLHNLIENYGDSFTEEMWTYIFQNTLLKLNQMNENQNFDFLFGRVIGIFLASFMINFDNNIQILGKLVDLQHIVNLLTRKKEYFRHTYDTKVYILGMTSLVLNQNLPEQFQIGFPQIFNTLTVLLKNQQILSEKEAKQSSINEETLEDEKRKKQLQNKETLNNDMEESDDSIENEDEEIENVFPRPFDPDTQDVHPDIIQDDDILQRIKSKIVQMDEFSFFKNKLLDLKQQNYDLFQRLLNTLEQKNQQYLIQLLSIQRLQVDQNAQITQIRKVIKVKRSNKLNQQSQQQQNPQQFNIQNQQQFQ
ncbi:Armadillo-type fold [Pseudocohnilembus persalinus]|uniref:Armadillo-type fold n=1 Tax=Pseudocohnilembus persalinus TaxID=266149 RepID=A0A0V0Q7V2_PSEPJ|nr:Armadillo-type fold [Pseudocohnilembus persalinus]|eukprot:KRW98317.1 Armadillo-type fold [Pseudocohnilembus persalinus]